MEPSMVRTANRGHSLPQARPFAIDLQQLKFLVAASDSGSLRRAADLHSVGHSVISRSIAQLERQIGAVLLERSSGGVKATLAGRSVLRIARIILEQIDTLSTTGRANGRGEAGRLSVGFCTSISAGNLRTTLLDFKKQYPQIELAAVERPRTYLINALKNGTLDVLVVTSDVRSLGSKSLKLWSERILACFPEHHPLLARDVVYWTDLRGETVILSQYDPSHDLEDLMLSKLASPHERPKIDRHDVSRGIVKSLISMGLGIGLVLESDVGVNFGGLAYRDVRDGTGSSCIDFCAHWRPDNENPALGGFLKLLIARYPSLIPLE
ncbi:LysR family transcriptional regulator [Bradyrhizobium sp. KB893862 SZCCT0404]|nr:LysR family transcriptional regulator [Bradyrhizobium sp. KB893862 SZCCT0404]